MSEAYKFMEETNKIIKEGHKHYNNHNYGLALECYFIGNEIYKNKRKYEDFVADINVSIENTYLRMEKFDEALTYLFESLYFYQSDISDGGWNTLSIYRQISEVYIKKEDYENAIDFLKTTLAYSETNGLEYGKKEIDLKMKLLAKISNIKKGNFQENHQTIDEILELSTKLKYDGITLFKNNNFYDALSKFESGLSYIKDSYDKFKEIKLSFLLNICNCLNNLQKFELTIKNVSEAFKLEEHPKCFYYRGIAFLNLNNLKCAKNDFENLKIIYPNDTKVHEYLKIIEEKLNN